MTHWLDKIEKTLRELPDPPEEPRVKVRAKDFLNVCFAEPHMFKHSTRDVTSEMLLEFNFHMKQHQLLERVGFESLKYTLFYCKRLFDIVFII